VVLSHCKVKVGGLFFIGGETAGLYPTSLWVKVGFVLSVG
jgi:hypothetical protein